MRPRLRTLFVALAGLLLVGFQSRPPAEIVNISWRGAVFYGANYDKWGAFSIDLKNTGSKTITYVVWEFVLRDTIRRRQYDRMVFVTDDKKIRPGEKKRLTKRPEYHSPPDYIAAHARIVFLRFEDGSTWGDPSERPD